MNATYLVGRKWNFCYSVRDDGMDYGDYLALRTHLEWPKKAGKKMPQSYGD